MSFHRLAHLEDVKVKKGDKVRKGQPIATIGSTGNSTSAHLHWDKARTNQGKGYVNGWSKDEVKNVYIEPTPEKNIPINFSHYGWSWLGWYGKGYHPGVDLNGPGGGNSDLGNTIYSPVDGEVVYAYSGGRYNSGWGNLIAIDDNFKKDNMNKEDQEFYDYKEKARGWDTIADWVKAAREYRVERDEVKKSLAEMKDEKSNLKKNYERLLKRKQGKIEKLKKAPTWGEIVNIIIKKLKNEKVV